MPPRLSRRAEEPLSWRFEDCPPYNYYRAYSRFPVLLRTLTLLARRRTAGAGPASARAGRTTSVYQLTDRVLQHKGRLRPPNHATVGKILLPTAERNRHVFVAYYAAGLD